MSMAIASLGFITMLGLLPHGLELSRNAASISAESRINQKLAGELQTATWEDLNWEGYGPTRYFNDQGIELNADEVTAEGADSFSLSYVASVQMPAEPMDLVLPANNPNRPAETYLRRLRICIAPTSNPDFDFQSAPDRRVTSYTAIIAKN